MSDIQFPPRLFWIFLAGVGTMLAGCNEQASAGKSMPTTAAYGPTLVLKANLPGFSAESLATLVAAPIEKQLAALESLPLVESICTEGQVEFLLHTKVGCNLKQLESLISDRLASLKDALPQSLNDTGLQLQTKTAPLFVVALYSPDGKHDNTQLSNIVRTALLQQLTHVPGVGEVSVLGTGSADDHVTVKQHPGIAILLAPAVDAKPAEIGEALMERLGELRAELPEGLLLTLPVNLANMTDPRETLLLLELQLPQGTDVSRIKLELSVANARLRELPGIKSWVGFTRHPLESANHNPCVIVHAASTEPAQAQAKTRAAIQELFAPNLAVPIRLKNFGKPDPSLIRAAVSGPDVMVADELAGKLVNRLNESRSYTADHQRSPTETKPQIVVKLDRSKLAVHGVTSSEITAALEKTIGIPPHEDTAREQISIPDTPQPASASALTQCRVKNAQGHEIALSDLATIDTVSAKLVVYRVNNQPAVLLAAQALGEQKQQDQRDQIAAFFSATRSSVTHGDEYKLTWLEE